MMTENAAEEKNLEPPAV